MKSPWAFGKTSLEAKENSSSKRLEMCVTSAQSLETQKAGCFPRMLKTLQGKAKLLQYCRKVILSLLFQETAR